MEKEKNHEKSDSFDEFDSRKLINDMGHDAHG